MVLGWFRLAGDWSVRAPADNLGNCLLLFNSFTYLVFLPLVVLLYWLVAERLRKLLLLVASYVFYMNWMPAYGLLILGLTVVNYFLGLAIGNSVSTPNASLKKPLLVAGLIFNIGCLCFFKYANFLIDSFLQSIHWVGAFAQVPGLAVHQSPALNVILPLGISFFTFEFIHYIVDVYRGSSPITNFPDFALFAAFFPSQIAGPIKRFQDFRLQLEKHLAFRDVDFRTGIFLIMQGLYKKVVLGDNLGMLVAYGFSHIQQLGTLDAWLAMAAFQFQIFFDFSGYTDIGRGSALLFGYKVPENFDWPFIAANLTQFWHRWHMSLSTWLRDYLFIPLGGSRTTPWMVRRNVMITMILGGLWHGAAWHYVVWGAFHGAGLVLSKEWHDFVSSIKPLAALRPSKVWHYSGVVLTILFLFVAGTLFRADSLPNTVLMLQKAITLDPSGELTKQFLESTCIGSLAVYMLFLLWRSWLAKPETQTNLFVASLVAWWNDSTHVRAVSYVAIALLIIGFAPGKIAPFIYFQF
jgi:alginate O-acetyltransferase complex protein AlgI